MGISREYVLLKSYSIDFKMGNSFSTKVEYKLQQVGSSVGTKVKEAQSEMMITQTRRQLIMQNEMRERGMSMQLAMARRQFQYWTVFVTPLALLLPIAAIKTKKPQLIAPLWPLGIVTTFQYDMAHG